VRSTGLRIEDQCLRPEVFAAIDKDVVVWVDLIGVMVCQIGKFKNQRGVPRVVGDGAFCRRRRCANRRALDQVDADQGIDFASKDSALFVCYVVSEPEIHAVII